jgi:imidazolonepropionase-like amidohydrolase
MRTVVVNAAVIDGTGAEPKADCCVIVQDHMIEDVRPKPAPYYDRADQIIDARGGFVLPGLVNHHAHGLTRGPLMITGQEPLSTKRVQENLGRLLRQGVTTALNVDGFPTAEDAIASSRFQPVAVKTSTLHTPRHLDWASRGPFASGKLGHSRHWNVMQMLERGALAIGEAGPGLDPHWKDYALIPRAVELVGGRADVAAARSLRAAAESNDRGRLAAELDRCGAAGAVDHFLDLYDAVRDWDRAAESSLEEAIGAARSHGVPLIFHHSPATHEIQLESAAQLGERHIAAHSNFQCDSATDAITRARAVKRRGGLVDIMSGDCFSGREFQATTDITFGLLAAGVVDLISTDYAGGFWDAILLLIEHAAEAGAVTLGEGVRMATAAPARAIPGLAPDRGVLAAGQVADLVVTEPGHLSTVRQVLVSGRPVPLPVNDWS